MKFAKQICNAIVRKLTAQMGIIFKVVKTAKSTIAHQIYNTICPFVC